MVTWIPALLLSPLGGGMTASARQRSLRSATFAEAQLLVRDLAITNLATAAEASNPILFRRSRCRGGGRNARATSRASAFLEFPPVIHPRESPAAAGSAAIIRQVQDSHVFAGNTLRQIAAARNIKQLPRCAEPVDDESSLWKGEEK